VNKPRHCERSVAISKQPPIIALTICERCWCDSARTPPARITYDIDLCQALPTKNHNFVRVFPTKKIQPFPTKNTYSIDKWHILCYS